MKSYNSGLAGGLHAEERSTENQWSQSFPTQSFGQKVTALENYTNRTKRAGWRDTGGEREDKNKNRLSNGHTENMKTSSADALFLQSQGHEPKHVGRKKKSRLIIYKRCWKCDLLLVFSHPCTSTVGEVVPEISAFSFLNDLIKLNTNKETVSCRDSVEDRAL